ncbi:hypothetical protein ACGF0J_17555 [Nonomuraea sp. NPDC047897]|uniref:hypothetical protein n=1 Tax=Nonomuraea sp. NPDC047897 TaxID=3364346 RepID=UPI0037103BF8
MIRRGWVVAGTMMAAGASVVPAAASGVPPVLDRVDDADLPGPWARAGDELRFRVRLTGPGRAARLALAAGPARALTSVSCAPADDGAVDENADDGAVGENADAAGPPELTFHALAPDAADAAPPVRPSPDAEGMAVTPAEGMAVTPAEAAAVPAGVRSAMRRAYAAAESARPVPAGRASACALGDVRGWHEVDVRLTAPYGAREVVLAAVARMGEREGGGVTVVSRAVTLPVVDPQPGQSAPGSAGFLTAGEASIPGGAAVAGDDVAEQEVAQQGVGQQGVRQQGVGQQGVRRGRGAEDGEAQAAAVREAGSRAAGDRAAGDPAAGVRAAGVRAARDRVAGAREVRAVAGVDGRPARHGVAARSFVEAPPPAGYGVVPAQPFGAEPGDELNFPAATPAPPWPPPQAPLTGSADGGLGAPLPRLIAMSAARPERSRPVNVLAGPQGVAVAGGGIAVLLGALWGVSRVQQARIRKKVR